MFLENLKQLHINLPFIEALAQIPKYTKYLKGLLTNKARLEEACTITINERCSAVLLNKLPSKEKDPGSFTIPCDIGQLHINNALADLGSSISLMPYMMYKKLGLGEPKATRMSLELVNRKTFLATARAMIDLFNKKITLRVGDDEVIFDVDQSIKRPPAKDDECYGVDDLDDTINAEAQELLASDKSDTFLLKGLEKLIDQSDLESCEYFKCKAVDNSDSGEPIWRINSVNTPYPVVQETTEPNKVKSENLYSASANENDEKKPELKNLPHHLEYAYLHRDKSFPIIISSAFLSYCTHKILMEDDYKPVIQPQRRLNPKVQDVVKNEIVKLLDFGLIYPISYSSWVSPVYVVPNKGGMTVVLNDNNELISSSIVIGWQVRIYYRKLNDATQKDHFPLPFIDQMIFAYQQMSFGLCNAPTTFQRCMTAIFHDMVEDFMEVFMDDFSVFGKCHFMVKEGIVLGHKISRAGIEVDRAKIDLIAKLPYPTNVKGVRSFLGHAGFYRSDFAVGAVLGQRIYRKFKPIYYASKTLNNAQEHYTTIEKELLVDVKPRLIRWVLLLQGFDIEIKDKKGAKNLAADHLSRLKNPDLGAFTEEEIADKLVGYNLKNWSEKLDDTLWAFRTAYKTPTRCTPFRLVNEKACHLPVEIEHKAYWALKQCNMDLRAAAKNHFMELNELMKLRDGAYENTRIYKERTKRWHDSRLHGDNNFKVRYNVFWNGYSRKGQKESQKRQNKARDGKDQVKSKPKSVKVKKSTGKSTPKKSKVK
ncbi:reverse transcriptase domain-containing protein [Tanacetum coccineum]